MTTQAERYAEAHAAAIGIPVHHCPNCGRIAAHWIPERIEDNKYEHGYYTCGDAA